MRKEGRNCLPRPVGCRHEALVIDSAQIKRGPIQVQRRNNRTGILSRSGSGNDDFVGLLAIAG
ncbi:MAG: hypothetical protein MZV63_25035 [Marinilabiliales bacterium]|nr:hypothetical protein [Marinilabiliales bacterium]